MEVLIARRQARRRELFRLLTLIVEEELGKNVRTRRHWVRPFLQKRKETGDFYVAVPDMLNQDPELFFQIFRFTPAAFEDLLKLVGPLLAKNFVVREPISEAHRLLITLEYLACGDMQKSLAKDYRVGRSTVCNIIKETCNAIIATLMPKVLATPSTNDWLKYGKGFHTKWNFPNCVGAIDGKHFAIQRPAGSGSMYFNYKQFFSVVLLATCDDDYNFTTINIGAAGSESDGGIFRRSLLGQKMITSTLNLPPPTREPTRNLLLPYHFVADEAFPLLQNMMRPYPGSGLSLEERIFNYRLSRARRIIENTFGILVTRWRLLLDTIRMHPENAEIAIQACIVLHNYSRAHDSTKNLYTPNGYVDYEDPQTGQLRRGHWREIGNASMLRLRAQGSHNSSNVAQKIRDNYKTYVNYVEPVPWQNNSVADY